MTKPTAARRTFVTSGTSGARRAPAAASPGAGLDRDAVVSVLKDGVPAETADERERVGFLQWPGVTVTVTLFHGMMHAAVGLHLMFSEAPSLLCHFASSFCTNSHV